jgi:histidyl-tRNA synthetase
VDIIGSTSLVVEVELCSAVCDVLTLLGFGNFSIRLNHRATLTALLTAVGIPEEQQEDALVATDKFDKIGPAGVQEELERRGIDSKAAVAWLTFLQASPVDHAGGNSEWIERARELTARSQRPDGLEELSTILSLAGATTAAGRFRFDPTLARGLSYYTGAIMEVAVPDLAGSLGGGGRYDNLVGQFLGRDIPACGFSLGLERILVVMSERNMFPESVVRGSADVMVTIWSDELRRDALELASDLRTAGIRVDVYLEAGKIPAQFKYASSRNYPFVTVVGDDERQNGTVTVRDMRNRKQETVARAVVGEFLKGLLKE